MISSGEFVVEINAARLHGRLDGDAAAPVVVLIHSLGTDLRLWDAQMPALAKGWRVLRYDMRGHGRSTAPPGPYSIDLLARDLLGLLAHFGIPRAHIVGTSLGALTAIAAALRGVPEIASIAVCNTRTDMSPEFAAAIDARNRTIRANGLAPQAATIAARWLAPATLATRPALLDHVRAMLSVASPEGFISCTEAVKTAGLDDHLAAIRVPALFVASAQDGGLPVAVMRAMQQRVPGARFAVIPDAGHLACLEQPTAFNTILLDFLGSMA